MHELPKDLTSSLRSYRGSIYSARGRQDNEGQEVDLEKGTDQYRDKDFERALSPTQSYVSDDSHPPPVVHDDQGHDDQHYGQQHDGDQHDDHDDQDHHDPQKPSRTQPPPLRTVPRAVTYVSPTTPQTKEVPAQESRSDIFGGMAVKDLDPAANRLSRNLTPLSQADFCTLMGIRPWSSSSSLKRLHDLAEPGGLYHIIYHAMRSKSHEYRLFDLATYALLIVQLIISAIFIILGALPNLNSHVAIAVLGAVATIIAGTLALMKGQGLPNRLRMTRDGLNSVIFEAEELYWDVRTGRPVLFKDIKKIREDYQRVIQQARAHHPDAWTEEAGQIGAGASKRSSGFGAGGK